jgi:hypothetical protein
MEIGDERCDTMWNPVVHSLLLTALYMKNFSQTHALQAVDLNSISNLYLVSLQPYVFRAEYGRGGCNYGTKRRLGLSVYIIPTAILGDVYPHTR